MRKVYSHSRREVLAKCLRQYFFEYYAASIAPAAQTVQLGLFDRKKPGRGESIELERVEAVRRLKDLTNVYMLAGGILHTLIATYLKGSRWSQQWFLKTAAERFDRAVIYSRAPVENAAMAAEPYPPPMLLEFYYGDPEAEMTAATARKRLLTALGNFFDVPAVSSLTSLMLEGHEVLVERHISGMSKAGEFGIQGMVDFASVGPSGMRILDWKMGGSVGDQDSLQLSLYGTWASGKFNVEPTNVIVQRVFLGEGVVEREHRLDERIMRRGEARLLQDVELMEELDRYGQTGVEGAFSPCEKEKVCRQCKFQEICPATRSALGSRQTSGSRPAVGAAS